MDKRFIQLAINNITKYGDTDIFPFPIENHIIYDMQEEIINLIQKMDKAGIEAAFGKVPAYNLHSVISSGYTGFRWGTQIDPIWNIYYLSLVLSISDQIESNRIKKNRNAVFSYRYMPDGSSLFDPDFGWHAFYKESKLRAKKSKYVLICDISNFYQRIYHHKLENALEYIFGGSQEVKNVMKILQSFSDNTSYGLPIGGAASRILAEMSLNAIDDILDQKDISFCRFVDDYHIFASSKEEAYKYLVYISNIMISEHGLSLQKAKTRILTSEEFLTTPDKEKQDVRRLMDISIRFDPYSPTAFEDYDSLKNELSSIDLIGLLHEELAKTMIHQSLVSKIIKSLHVLDKSSRIGAIQSIMENLEILYPVLPVVFITIKNMFDEFDIDFKNYIINKLVSLYKTDSYIIQTENNLAYMIRILSCHKTSESVRVLNNIYEKSTNPLILKDVILTMAKFNNRSWLSCCMKGFEGMDSWCRRATIISSFVLMDAGDHWRRLNCKRNVFSEFELLILKWAATRSKESHWSIPL